jgi:hypothetical protein
MLPRTAEAQIDVGVDDSSNDHLSRQHKPVVELIMLRA